jgi:DNA invertase Pin-like site-specific DNA recombinase
LTLRTSEKENTHFRTFRGKEVAFMQKTFAYIRVSSRDQHTDRQTEAMRPFVSDERAVFTDKQSGHTFARAAYQALKLQLRPGDTVYVKSLDRFGRNKDEMKRELEWFRQSGVTLRILDVPTTMLDFSQFGPLQKAIMEMVNNILIEVLGTFAEQERAFIKERQREGIAAAKKKNVKFGRPLTPFPPAWPDYYARWKQGEVTASGLMQALGLKRSTFYSLLKRFEQTGLR